LDDEDNDRDDKKNISIKGGTRCQRHSPHEQKPTPALIVSGDELSSAVITNVWVYALAEYYHIPPLKQHAVEKLLSRLAPTGKWPTEGLMLALHLVTNLVRENDMLHELICAAAVKHAAALVAYPRFVELLHAGGAFAAQFTQALAAQRQRESATQREQLDAATLQHAEVTALLAREKAEHAAATASLRAQLDAANGNHATAAGILSHELARLAAETASLRVQLDAANGNHQAASSALRASHAQKEKKWAAEAESVRAQLADAQQKLATERTRRLKVEKAHSELRAGINALGRESETAHSKLMAGFKTLVPANGGSTSEGGAGAAAKQNGRPAVQQPGVGRGGHQTVSQPGVAGGGLQAVQQSGAGRGGQQAVQQPGVGRGGIHAVQQSGVGRGGQQAVQQPGVGRGGTQSVQPAGRGRGIGG
jgi:hypothetical protein